MSLFQKIRTHLHDDPLLQRVIRNSSYLFSSNAVSAVMSVIQMIIVVRLLNVDEYGLATGTIMVFATSVNQLLSFRMSEVVVKYAGDALTHGRKDRAAALIKGIGLTEAATSVLAYLVLVLLASWAASTFAHNASTAPLFVFYGLYLLANLVYETSTGALQTVNHFGRVARANFYQTTATFFLVVVAGLMGWGIVGVLLAYLVGKTVAGLMISISAFREVNKALGTGWHRTPLSLVHDWKFIGRFMLSTNLNGTVNLLVRDNIPLYIGYLLTTTEVGYFKFALTLINLIKLPIEPFIWPTYAEITRTIAQKQWAATKKLLRQVSSIAGAWTLLTGVGLIALGWWLIPLVFGADYAPSYPAAIILMIGYGVANILNWNRPLLLALGQPRYPLFVSAFVGAIELALFFWLVPQSNYLVASAIFSAYLAVSVPWMVWHGLKLIKQEEAS
jgi:O-antigen/teichoic acid export membrane protein